MELKSNNNKTESIKDKKIEFVEEVSTDILEDIKKISDIGSGLVIIKGPNIGDIFLINKSKFTIGRNPESDFFLYDISVYMIHAVLEKIYKDLSINDSGSLNLSYFNGQIVENSILKDGYKIQIGKYIFLFFCHRKKVK